MVRGAAAQAAIASGVNQTVRLPRARRGGVILGPVGHPVPLLRDVMATGCLGFERHGRDPSVREGAVVLHRPAPDANRPIRATNSHGGKGTLDRVQGPQVFSMFSDLLKRLLSGGAVARLGVRRRSGISASVL